MDRVGMSVCMARERRARAGEPSSPGWGEAVPHNTPRDRPCGHPRRRPRRLAALLRVRPHRARPDGPLIDSEYIDWGDFSIVSDGQPVAKHLQIAFSAPSPEL